MNNTDQKTLCVSAFDESICSLAEEKEFLNQLELAIRSGTREPLNNHGTFDAVRLVHELFLHAAKEMRIFSGVLRRRERHASKKSYSGPMKIYEDDHVLGAMMAFLADSGTKLKIVVEGNKEDGIEHLDGGDQHPLVKKVETMRDAKMLRGSCEIARIDSDLAGELIRNGGIHKSGEDKFRHMIIMDNWAYRLETKEAEAKAGVNSPDRAKELARFFDDPIWTNAETLWSASRKGIDARWGEN